MTESIFDKYDLLHTNCEIQIPVLPASGLILIVGSSGSGKSTIINSVVRGEPLSIEENIPLYKLFSSPQKAEELLLSCGLRSIPVWRRSISAMSTGEAHRAICALVLDRGGETLDEFTSTVDRDTAKSLSVSIGRYFRGANIPRLIIGSCHRDIIEWLLPDHVWDTDAKMWLARGCLQRPRINLTITACDGEKVWEIFKKHHYLSHSYNKSANAFVATINGNPIGFCSILAFANGNFSNGWREHRTVIIPEFQGLGIGNRLSETIAQMVVDSGGRFFSKTSHPSMGLHRNASSLWRATTKNGKKRLDYISNYAYQTKEDGHKMAHVNRLCFSHEYIGGY